MNSGLHRKLGLLILAALFGMAAAVVAMAAGLSPKLNNAKKWRVAYLEGGPFLNYQGSLRATVQGLMTLGWMSPADIPRFPDLEDTQRLWTWLAGTARSEYIEFVGDGYWSSQWQKDRREQIREQIQRRIQTAADIDLFIGMGTWAGQDLVSMLDRIPVIVMSCSDPIGAKIVRSASDSGKDNVIAWCDPTRSERRLRLFHDILGFGRLGVIYEDTPEGRLYANLPSVQQVAVERGFTVVGCQAPETGLSVEAAIENAAHCIDRLAPQIDALIVSDHRGLHPGEFPRLIDPLLEKGVPVFTVTRGPTLVTRGVLMGIAREDYQPLGDFYAGTMAAIFNGAKPRDLPQIYQEPLKLAVNLEVARRIGYTIPPNVKRVADLIYETIDDQQMR